MEFITCTVGDTSFVRLASGSGSGPIDDIDGRMKRQCPRLLAGNSNDLAPGQDHILNHLTCGKHECDPVGRAQNDLLCVAKCGKLCAAN